MVVATITRYDPSRYPAFAVTVDVVVLTIAGGELRVLLIRRGVPPYEGRWAIPGGFKRPAETLEEAARRELLQEAGVRAPRSLKQFGAYGDPGRDPRMDVVTVGYLAVVRRPPAPVAGSDAAGAELVPVAQILDGRLELAFDHGRIVRDAIERVRHDLDRTDLATSFVDPTFTLAELRHVYEAIWERPIDAANFRRSVLSDDGWVAPTGRRAPSGTNGGKPAEIYRPGRLWKQGSPIRRKGRS